MDWEEVNTVPYACGHSVDHDGVVWDVFTQPWENLKLQKFEIVEIYLM